jgi:hypothetical protein
LTIETAIFGSPFVMPVNDRLWSICDLRFAMCDCRAGTATYAAFSPFDYMTGTARVGRKYALPVQQKTRARGSTHGKF